MNDRRFNSFSEFWPFYVGEHSQHGTRLLHLIGTIISIGVVAYFFIKGPWWLFPVALIPGYACAWLAHFLIEKNRPATFKHPVWSFMGDYKMVAMMLTGRMHSELMKAKKLKN